MPPSEEQEFQTVYAAYARKFDRNPNPDDSRHFYDYRALFKKEGVIRPDSKGHLPSTFKLAGHPRLIIEGVNTKTGLPVL